MINSNNRPTRERIYIKEKTTSDNKSRLYLVWYFNKKRVWESTHEFYFTKPQSPFERQHNKNVKIKVDALRIKREGQLFSGEIEDIIEQKSIKDQAFIYYVENYIENYDKKDIKVMRGVVLHLKAFAPPHLTTKDITEKFVTDFKAYLEKKLNGESPQSYFARFKKILRQATKEKLFRVSPAQDVVNKKSENSMIKDTLTVEELAMLTNAKCANEDVKKAFLFACNTGLRFVDVKALKWYNVKADAIEVKQTKTEVAVKVFLNENAKQFLGERGREQETVFKLPSHNATIDNLKNWAKRAGLDKHITFHCARHTFGTLLAYYETDILTISKLLGHTSLKHTTRYMRVADEMKIKAVNAIPTIKG